VIYGLIFVDKDKKNLDWIPAMRVFSEISTWIAVPMIAALIAGKALDKHYGTKPTLLLVSAAIGFIVTAFGITRTVRRYAAKLKKEESK
jgi:F0F1-type ATP synthase assembly protein I